MGFLRSGSIAAVSVWLAACGYYDPRFGGYTAEQRRTAAHLSPAAVEGQRPAEGVVRRTATVRACATAAYSAEMLDWETRFEELLRNANSVLEPSLGLTLRSAGTVHWQPPHGEGSLSTVIADLPSCEGEDSDWVVALVQSTPKVVSDFHVLGRGQGYSRYLAVRAPNDPAELTALTHALPDLDEATRQKLYSDRKRHKMLTLFLHELAHTLGAVHRTAKDTIMHPSYDPSERGYDGATLALLRLGLEIRLEKQNRYEEARQYLEAHPDGFVEHERREHVDLVTRWARSLPPPAPRAVAPTTSPAALTGNTPSTLPAGSAATVAVPAVQAVGFETMPKEDRQIFDEALKLEPTSPRDAWTVATPLFETHPAVRAVQELRCRLAKERKFYPAVVEAHCARLAALGPKDEANTE
jgi:hypothetical protein